MNRVYLRVYPSEPQNCSSANSCWKFVSPVNFGGVMSDQFVNDIPTIAASGIAVKISTKMTAGATYNSPVNLRRRLAVIRTPRLGSACWTAGGTRNGEGWNQPRRSGEAPRHSKSGSTTSTGLLAGDRLHGCLPVVDDGIEIVRRVVGLLE